MNSEVSFERRRNRKTPWTKVTDISKVLMRKVWLFNSFDIIIGLGRHCKNYNPHALQSCIVSLFAQRSSTREYICTSVRHPWKPRNNQWLRRSSFLRFSRWLCYAISEYYFPSSSTSGHCCCCEKTGKVQQPLSIFSIYRYFTISSLYCRN